MATHEGEFFLDLRGCSELLIMLGLQRSANSGRSAMKRSGWIMYAVVALFVFILIVNTAAFAEDKANLAKSGRSSSRDNIQYG